MKVEWSDLKDIKLSQEEIEYIDSQENNIFEGAKFGDKFVTKNGKIARFICTNNKNNSCLYINGRQIPDGYFPNGKYVIENKNDYDIVSRYQEPITSKEIDEDKLDELADEYINKNRWSDYDELSLGKDFKEGYRQAKEIRYE